MKEMIKPLFLTALFALLMASIAFAQTTKGTIIAVHDGDSFQIRFSPDSTDYIRLAGCDAPEVYSPYVTKNQPGGKEAAQILRDYLKGQVVEVDFLYYDHYGRPVCNITHGSTGDLSYWMVHNGFAWWLKEGTNPEKLKALKQAQDQAQEYKRGLWGIGGRKYRPATWRRSHRGF